jgi:hypothetical protein
MDELPGVAISEPPAEPASGVSADRAAGVSNPIAYIVPEI